MRLPVLLLSLAIAAVLPATATAGTAADALGICLADNTSGKERKTLARWIFISISSHPVIQDVSTVTPPVRERANREMAALVTKLLAESCPAETAHAMQSEGAQSLEAAFESLGKLAMVELMSNPDVATSIADYAKYLDDGKIEAAMGGQVGG